MALVQAGHRSSFENNYAVVVLGARKDFKAQAAPAQGDPEFQGDTVSLGQDALVSCALAPVGRCANLAGEDVILRSGEMGQLGFFDAERRLAALSAKGDPLETIVSLVPWESFRADIEAVVLTPEEAKKSKAGRKPFDAILMFRMLILQSLYNLSDEQIEYQVRDRMSFTRFLDLEFEDDVPDGTTLWLFREKLAQAGLVETLFERFNRHLSAKGYIARGGQMVDATIVPPKQRNSREENETVKRGETPAEWEQKPAKNRQKDKDARWTKKHGKSLFGYKNHVEPTRPTS